MLFFITNYKALEIVVTFAKKNREYIDESCKKNKIEFKKIHVNASLFC